MRKLLVAATLGMFVLAAAPDSADAKRNRRGKIGKFFKGVKAKFQKFAKKAKAKFNAWKPKTKFGKMLKGKIGSFAKKMHGKLKAFGKKARHFVGKLKGKLRGAIHKGAGLLQRLAKKGLNRLGKWKPRTALGKRIKGGLTKLGHKGLKFITKGKRFLLRKLNKLPGPKAPKVPVPVKTAP